MILLSIKFRHECELSILSRKYPSVSMTQWCNFRTDILEINGGNQIVMDDIRQVLGKLSEHEVEVVRNDPDRIMETLIMTCYHTYGRTDEIVDESGSLLLQPTLYQGGWENYRIIVLDESKVESLMNNLKEEGEVELVLKKKLSEGSMKDSFVISTGELLSKLTRKQATALLSAVNSGYYEVPRRTRFEDIANSKNVPRTTYEEHVRKAESKIMKAIAPYISFFMSGSVTK